MTLAEELAQKYMSDIAGDIKDDAEWSSYVLFKNAINEAIERCAKECDKVFLISANSQSQDDFEGGYQCGAEACGDSIRALKG